MKISSLNGKHDNYHKIGEIFGFIVMYLIFATILYFILVLTGKINPFLKNYIYVSIFIVLLVLIGTLIKFLLEI